MFDPDEMDWVRGAIANACIEGLTIDDLWFCAEYAATPQDFDNAVNLLAQTVPEIEEPTT